MENFNCQNLDKFGTPWEKDPWGKIRKTQGKRSKNQIGKSKVQDRPN